MFILIIQKDQQMFEKTNQLLEQYQIQNAGTSIEAIELTKQSRPDLVLLDINLPESDGYEVCRSIKSIDNSIKIIFFTEIQDIESRLKAYNSGADDFISRPYNDEELLAKMNTFRRLIEAEQILKTKNSLYKDLVIKMTEQSTKKVEYVSRFQIDAAQRIQGHLAAVRAYSNLLTLKYQDEDLLDKIVFNIDLTEDLLRTTLLTKLEDQHSEFILNELFDDLTKYLKLKLDIQPVETIKIAAVKSEIFEAIYILLHQLTENLISVIQTEESTDFVSLNISQKCDFEPTSDSTETNIEIDYAKSLIEANLGKLSVSTNSNSNNFLGFTIHLKKIC